MARKKHAAPAGTGELSLSRSDSVEYYSDKIRSRSRKRIVRTVLTTILTLVVAASVAVAAYINDINRKITGHVDSNLKTVLAAQEAGEPFYLLLIGIDKDEGRVNDPTYGSEESGYRSDSIMLTRIDPGEKKVTMVSIHRDTLVDLGEHGQQKINAAYSIGQETYTTQVISEFAGVPIAHYAEVDMDGLAAVIDSVGGIDVTLDMDVKDPYYTGLDLEKGTHHLDGHTAALFCRCRHAYDELGDGDRYRAANQRMVIATVARKVLASDPATIAATVSTMASYIRTDMDVQTIVSLAMQFIGMDVENDFYMGMEPTTSRYINDTWYELCDTVAWQKMMQRVDKGLPPTEEGDVDPLETSPDSLSDPSDESEDSGTYYYDDSSSYDGYDYDSYYDGYYDSQSYDGGGSYGYYEGSSSGDQSYYEEPAYEEPVYEEPTYEDASDYGGGMEGYAEDGS